MIWYKTGNGRLGIKSLAAGATALVQADTGEVWKVISICYTGGITVHYVDATGLDCEFYTSRDEKGSEEFSNLQIQDSSKMWLEIENDNESTNVIAIDAIVW